MKISLLGLILCSLVIPSYGNNIMKNDDIFLVDSLLFQKKFEEIELFFIKKDNEFQMNNTSEKDRDLYQNTKKPYFELIEFSRKIKSQDGERLSNLTDQYLNFESRFDSLNAGKKAQILYEKFKMSRSQGNIEEALISYRIAHFFKLKYMDRTIADARQIASEAYVNFGAHDLDSAENKIKDLYQVHDHIALPPALIDSLEILQLKISEIRVREERERSLWEIEATSKNDLNITVGINILNQSSAENVDLELVKRDGSESRIVTVESFPAKYVNAYSGMIEYRISQAMLMGIDFNYAKYTYSTKNLNILIFLDLNVKNYSGHLYLKYQPRRQFGLQPFALFGTGWLKSNMDRQEGHILDLTNQKLVYFVVPEDSFETLQFLYQAGLDYLPYQYQSFIIGIKINVYQNLKHYYLFTKFTYSIGMYVGFWF